MSLVAEQIPSFSNGMDQEVKCNTLEEIMSISECHSGLGVRRLMVMHFWF